MPVVEVPVREALAPSLLAGYDWALNPYRGCAFDCLYCYAPDVVHVERDTWGTSIAAKRSIPTVLARELKAKERGVIGLSTVTDPYQPAERRLEITRRCLEAIARAQWPVSVLTKSPLVTRDLDILRTIPGAEVGFSIATASEAERKRWEPSCPPIRARFEALKEVTAGGVRGYVFAGPIFPESAPESVSGLARLAAASGASEVIADSLHPRAGKLALLIEAKCPIAPGQRAGRTDTLLKALEDACRSEGLPFTLAANWKPRGLHGGGRRQHLVPARAAEKDPAVLKEPGEVARLPAALAHALAADARLEEFD